MARRKRISTKGVERNLTPLDYHEGISSNQAKIILTELGLGKRIDEFDEWMYGQTCPCIYRTDARSGKVSRVGGVYEYDLFRWIANQKKGAPLIWD